MEIRQIDIEGFGVFFQKKITGIKKGVNLFFGRNEAGKTTLLDFIRFTLIEYPRFIDQRRPPINGGNHGGSLFLESQKHGVIQLYRNGNGKTFELTVNAEKTTSTAQYNALIDYASSDLYKNIYAITLDELNSVDTLNDSGMQDRIFSLGMGLSGADYGSFEKSLLANSEEHFKARGSKQILTRLVNEIHEKEEKISILQSKLVDYERLSEQKIELEHKIRELAERQNHLRKEKNELNNYLAAKDFYVKYAHFENLINEIGELKNQPIEMLESYKTNQAELEITIQKIADLQLKIEQEEEKITSFKIKEEWVEFHDFIDYIKRNINSFTAAKTELLEKKQSNKDAKNSIEQLLQKLGKDFSVENISTLSGDHLLQTEATKCIQIENEISARLQNIKTVEENLEEAINSLLRRKTALEETIKSSFITSEEEYDKAKEEKVVWETDYDSYLANPNGGTINNKVKSLTISVVFLLIGLLLFFFNVVSGGIVTIVSLVIMAFSFWFQKDNKSSNYSKELNPLTLRKKIEEIKQNIFHYETNTRELENVSNELLEKERKLAQQSNIKEELERSRKIHLQEWEEVLLKNNLPNSISPLAINDVITNIREIQKLQNSIEKANEKAKELMQFISAFEEKLDPLVAKESTDEMYLKLLSDLEENQRVWREISTCKQKIKELGEELLLVESKYKALHENILEYQKSIGVENSSDFLLYFEKLEKLRQYQNERNENEQNIKRFCGIDAFEDTVSYLKSYSKAELETQFQEKEMAFTLSEGEYLKENKELSALESRLQFILKPDELFQLQNEKESLRLQLKDATKEWITTQITLKVLRENKDKYESNHQPEVIKNTGAYFRKITDGAYTNVRVSMSDGEVLVFDELEKSKSIKELSRGTKEQLLLALRLGLIEEYEKNAEPLPVIFDDIMVNFDYDRTHKYAEIIMDFAQNRQVIYFTCHEYVKDIFKENGANIIEW